MAFVDLDLAGRRAEAVEFAQCRFRATSLAGAQLTRVRLVNCVLDASDWSNLRGEGGTLDRTTVSGCRMTGLAWPDGLLRDASLREGKLDLTNWRFATFDLVGFTDCNLTGADFTGADLRGASFTRCRLTGAQFSQASMVGASFRGCDLAGIGGIASWAGAVVHRDDLLELSYVFARALGVVVAGDDG